MTISAQASVSLTTRDVAALAAACLLIDDAHRYGLIDSDLGVDRAECRRIVDRARRAGFVPDPEEVELKAIAVMAAAGMVRE